MTVSVAESLTAGLIASTIGRVAGASGYFVGGVVSYSERIKETLLGVDAETIARDGVVSQACAEQMATGVRTACGTRASVAVTGEAGPRASSAVAVGMVWVACSVDDLLVSQSFHFDGDRDSIREQTATVALALLIKTILSHPAVTI